MDLGKMMIVLAEAVSLGDELVVELDGEQVVARRGLAVIGRLAAPPARVQSAIIGACGVATGRVVDVDHCTATLALS